MLKNRFSIKDLEQFSAIKAHTLRIWEKRYGILDPHRTKTNIRWYSNEDLKRLLSIGLLYRSGFKISKIAKMGPAEFHHKVEELASKAQGQVAAMDSLVIAMVEMDELRFEKIFANSVIKNGFERTIENIIYPFLVKVGFMWQTGSSTPAQEHFISNLIRQKIISAIDGLAQPVRDKSKRVLLFLPENELHELGLLYCTYLVRSKGHQATYLGQSVPLDDLKRACEIRKPDVLISVITSPLPKAREFIKQLTHAFPGQRIILSGAQLLDADQKNFPGPIKIIRSFAELDTALA